MQKKAELAELNKSSTAAGKSENAAAAAPAAEPAAAPDAATAAPTDDEKVPEEGAEKAAANDEEQTVEADQVSESKALEDEIKELDQVHAELQERSNDLVSQKQQVRTPPLALLSTLHAIFSPGHRVELSCVRLLPVWCGYCAVLCGTTVPQIT